MISRHGRIGHAHANATFCLPITIAPRKRCWPNAQWMRRYPRLALVSQ
jgi:hypothetical protein